MRWARAIAAARRRLAPPATPSPVAEVLGPLLAWSSARARRGDLAETVVHQFDRFCRQDILELHDGTYRASRIARYGTYTPNITA